MTSTIGRSVSATSISGAAESGRLAPDRCVRMLLQWCGLHWQRTSQKITVISFAPDSWKDGRALACLLASLLFPSSSSSSPALPASPPSPSVPPASDLASSLTATTSSSNQSTDANEQTVIRLPTTIAELLQLPSTVVEMTESQLTASLKTVQAHLLNLSISDRLNSAFQLIEEHFHITRPFSSVSFAHFATEKSIFDYVLKIWTEFSIRQRTRQLQKPELPTKAEIENLMELLQAQRVALLQSVEEGKSTIFEAFQELRVQQEKNEKLEFEAKYAKEQVALLEDELNRLKKDLYIERTIRRDLERTVDSYRRSTNRRPSSPAPDPDPTGELRAQIDQVNAENLALRAALVCRLTPSHIGGFQGASSTGSTTASSSPFPASSSSSLASLSSSSSEPSLGSAETSGENIVESPSFDLGNLELRREMRVLKRTNSAFEHSVKDLKDDVSKAQADVGRLEREKSQLKKDLSAAETRVHEQAADLLDARKSNRQLSREVERLRSELDRRMPHRADSSSTVSAAAGLSPARQVVMRSFCESSTEEDCGEEHV